jgi:hypothetical protein
MKEKLIKLANKGYISDLTIFGVSEEVLNKELSNIESFISKYIKQKISQEDLDDLMGIVTSEPKAPVEEPKAPVEEPKAPVEEPKAPVVVEDEVEELDDEVPAVDPEEE